MQKHVLEQSGLEAMLAALVPKNRVLAPVRRGRNSSAFAWTEDMQRVTLDYQTTVLPAKQAMLPPREELLHLQLAPEPGATAALPGDPIVLFGVHPCDLAAINQLDWAMLERHGVRDPNYAARRAATTIIGVECCPDDYCFCSSVGTADNREGADLFLIPFASGYGVEVLTPRGEELLRTAGKTRAASPEEAAKWDGWSAEKARLTTRRLEAEVAEFPRILDERYDSDVWAQTAERCYSCGTCTNSCPTCFCFEVEDQVDLTQTTGTRSRHYDSCQFLEFTVVAGGHNFRKGKPDRVRHRFLRKFAYLNQEYGRAFCVGCGRCGRQCTAGISLTSVLNSVAAEAKEGRAAS